MNLLSRIFNERGFQFNTLCDCLNLVRKDYEYFVTYTGVIKSEWEKYKLNELT